MRSQVTTGVAGFFQANHFGAVSALLFSIILSACSGGYDNPESNDYVSPSLTEVTVQDADAPLRNDVVLGGTFLINITADEAIIAPSVMINGVAADSIVGAGTSWTASKVMTEDDADGVVTFNISYVDLNTNPGPDVSTTTDGSSIYYCAEGCGSGGGSTDGGTTDGGSTDGGSTDGGTTDGGSTDDGSTDGGSTDGGSTGSSVVTVFDAGVVGTIWDNGINAFDSAIGWGECNEDGGEGCPSIGWEVVADSERGDVLQVSHTAAGDAAGLFIGASAGQDVSAFAGGTVSFDINVVSGDSKITMKIDCGWPCTSGDQALGSKGASGWETVTVAVDDLVAGGLDLTAVNTGFVIWATDATSTVFQLDNVQWVAAGGSTDGGSTDGGSTDGGSADGGSTGSSVVTVFDAGVVGTIWDNGINAFDSAIGWGECNEDGGEGCPSIGWEVVADSERGDVLQVSHTAAGDAAGLFIGSSTGQDVSAFAGGTVSFDINVVSGDSKITMKIDCGWPCTSGDQALGSKGASGWETVTVAVDDLVAGGLDLTAVNTGFVVWATDATSTVFQLDNVQWVAAGGSTDGGSTDGGSTDGGSTDGGSTDGGSTDGGSTDGGSTDGGSDASSVVVFDEGAVGTVWDNGINAFDSAIGWGECNEDGGEGCPSIGWEVVADSERGDVLQITHTADGDAAGLFIGSSTGQDVSAFAGGNVVFDINVVSGDSKITMKIDCGWPCTSGDQALGSKGASGWETVSVPVDTLVAGGLDLTAVNTGFVIWATDATSTIFEIDNVRWETGGSTGGGSTDGGSTDGGSTDGGSTDGGSTDGDEAVSDVISMTGSFGGASLDGSTYTFTSAAQVWAGYANTNTDVYPFTFVNGGSITFNAAVASGGVPTNVYFRFENEPYLDSNPSIVEPSFETTNELISGEDLTEYTVTIPPQDAENTYSSLILYVVEQDSPVILEDVVITDDSGSTGLPAPEVEDPYTEPASPGIEILKDGAVTTEWGGSTSLSMAACGTCDEITLETVSDDQRGDVLQVSYSDAVAHAVLVIENTDTPVDVSAFSELSFDIKIVNIPAGVDLSYLAKSGLTTQPPTVVALEDTSLWQTISIPVATLTAVDLTAITAPFILAPDFNQGAGLVYQLDDVRWQ